MVHRRRAAAAAAILLAAALGFHQPVPAQQGGGTVTNSEPSVDADGTYANDTAEFGDQDGVLGAHVTLNDAQPGNTYDRVGAAAQGNWGQWEAIAGAAGVQSGNGTTQGGRYLKARVNATGATAEHFAFEVFDPNLETDLLYVRVESDHAGLNGTASAGGQGRAIAQADLDRRNKPASGPGVDQDGYAVWNPVASDGFLSVQFRYTWPAGQATGTFTQTACARDEGNWTCDTSNTDITAFSQNATLTVDFSAGNFTSGNTSIPIDGNLDFKWYVGSLANPSSVSSWQGSSDDADGALSVEAVAPSYVWVWYEIDIPGLAGDGTYVAPFTFS